MTFDKLKSILEGEVFKTSQLAREFPWQEKSKYALWLRQTYGFVRHSTRLLCLASSYSSNERIHHRFLDHSVEEKSHEKLIELDFKNLNLDIKDFEEYSTTSAFYQTQYYWIQHVNSICLFGYILYLEGLAVEVGPMVYKIAKESHGDSACNFIRVHVEADEDHLPKALNTLSDIPDQELNLVYNALIMTSDLYQKSLSQILNRN